MNFIIAVDPDPYADEGETIDIAKATADDYDSAITDLSPLGDGRGYDLIKDYRDDYPKLTVRQAVGIFGFSGMYREDTDNDSEQDEESGNPDD